MRGDMHARGPHFLAIDPPAIYAVTGFAHGDSIHMRGIRAVIWFCEPKGRDKLTV